ncbi:hypothetical protein Trydic_g16777 [Trypoxylus dichotomus]
MLSQNPIFRRLNESDNTGNSRPYQTLFIMLITNAYNDTHDDAAVLVIESISYGKCLRHLPQQMLLPPSRREKTAHQTSCEVCTNKVKGRVVSQELLYQNWLVELVRIGALLL